MSSPLALSVLGKVLLGLCLAGVVLRGRTASCWSFPAYVALVLVSDLVVFTWPERLYVPWFWIVQQAAWDIAKLAVAIEILWRAVRSYPGARPTAYAYAVALLALTTLVLLMAPQRGLSAYGATLVEWQPRMLTATVWLMTGTALLVLWYRIPITWFQRAILIGFVPYLVVWATLLNLLRRHGWALWDVTNLLDRIAYVLLLAWWTWSAWRSEADEALPRVLEQRLEARAS